MVEATEIIGGTWFLVFENYLQGNSPDVLFTVNGNTYNMGYFLADGIYPEWPAFVKTLKHTHDQKSAKFKERQEAARKDIERAFGVLQARWAVIRGPAYGWHKDQLNDIMCTCSILHNMIIENEGSTACLQSDFPQGSVPMADPAEGRRSRSRSEFVQRQHYLLNQPKHRQLQRDLIEHM